MLRPASGPLPQQENGQVTAHRAAGGKSRPGVTHLRAVLLEQPPAGAGAGAVGVACGCGAAGFFQTCHRGMHRTSISASRTGRTGEIGGNEKRRASKKGAACRDRGGVCGAGTTDRSPRLAGAGPPSAVAPACPARLRDSIFAPYARPSARMRTSSLAFVTTGMSALKRMFTCQAIPVGLWSAPPERNDEGRRLSRVGNDLCLPRTCKFLHLMELATKQ